MAKKTVALIFGGYSSEYPVSLKSAHNVLKHMNYDKYDVICIGITDEGKWLRYYGDIDKIFNDEWRKSEGECVPVVLLPDRHAGGILEFKDGENVFTDLSGKGSEETVSVGIIGSIPCGNLSLEEEAIEEIVQLPTAIFGKGNLFMLHASGDSMTGAGIDDGDLVLIRKQEEARNGDIVVAFIEGEGNTLKRYRQYGNTVFLHPENPKYTDIPLQDCKIQGIAVSVIKQL